MSESTGPKIVNGVQIVGTSEVHPWHMLGWLEGTLTRKGQITKRDWNDAADASRRFQQSQTTKATGEPTT